MSETDSFIEEVSEEVRKDRLFALMRKYGWIAVLAVLLVVSGTAYREYIISQRIFEAEKTGDAILAAMELETNAQRAEAIGKIESEDQNTKIILHFLQAAELSNASEPQQAAAALQSIEDLTKVGKEYSDLEDKTLANGVLDYSQWTPPPYSKIFKEPKFDLGKPHIVVNNNYNVEFGQDISKSLRYFDIPTLTKIFDIKPNLSGADPGFNIYGNTRLALWDDDSSHYVSLESPSLSFESVVPVSMTYLSCIWVPQQCPATRPPIDLSIN